jgi:hypothetical protein
MILRQEFLVKQRGGIRQLLLGVCQLSRLLLAQFYRLKGKDELMELPSQLPEQTLSPILSQYAPILEA